MGLLEFGVGARARFKDFNLLVLLGFLSSDLLLNLVLPGSHRFLSAFLFFCSQAVCLALTYKGAYILKERLNSQRRGFAGSGFPSILFTWGLVFSRLTSRGISHS